MNDIKPLLNKMKSLKRRVALEVTKKAGRKGALVIKKQVLANLASIDDPQTKNDIRKNVTVKFNILKFNRTGDVSFRVGMFGGAKTAIENSLNPGGDTFYWRFLEFGTARTQARPFMRPALLASQAMATQVFFSQFKKEMDKLA